MDKKTEEKVTNYNIPDQLHNWKFEEYYKDKNQSIFCTSIKSKYFIDMIIESVEI